MSKVLSILKYEEGYQDAPFIGISGYPTVGSGIKIGPKGASLSGYIFRVPEAVNDLWMQTLLNGKISDMKQRPVIAKALQQCNQARSDILYSMAYQLGIDGLAEFREALKAINCADFSSAADGMLNSLWARKMPGRAMRHAAVMRSGDYYAYRGLI